MQLLVLKERDLNVLVDARFDPLRMADDCRRGVLGFAVLRINEPDIGNVLFWMSDMDGRESPLVGCDVYLIDDGICPVRDRIGKPALRLGIDSRFVASIHSIAVEMVIMILTTIVLIAVVDRGEVCLRPAASRDARVRWESIFTDDDD